MPWFRSGRAERARAAAALRRVRSDLVVARAGREVAERLADRAKERARLAEERARLAEGYAREALGLLRELMEMEAGTPQETERLMRGLLHEDGRPGHAGPAGEGGAAGLDDVQEPVEEGLLLAVGEVLAHLGQVASQGVHFATFYAVRAAGCDLVLQAVNSPREAVDDPDDAVEGVAQGEDVLVDLVDHDAEGPDGDPVLSREAYLDAVKAAVLDGKPFRLAPFRHLTLQVLKTVSVGRTVHDDSSSVGDGAVGGDPASSSGSGFPEPTGEGPAVVGDTHPVSISSPYEGVA